MAEQAGRTEKVEHVDHEERMEDGCGEFYMAKVSRARIITCMTRFTPIKIQMPFQFSGPPSSIMEGVCHAQVIAVARTQRRIIQSPRIRTVEVIQESRVDDLLDRDSTDVLRSQE